MKDREKTKTKRSNSKKTPESSRGKRTSKMANSRLLPPPDSVVVRMYRIGHGDCTLIAFPSDVPEKPVYVLIDCGYKPGSPGYINTTPKEITTSIREATDGHIDVVVITHEHQDHVNAFTKENFKNVTIGQVWFAWTEDPDDEVATKLRKIYKDQLLGLWEARKRLSAAGDLKRTDRIDDFLAFELGGDTDETREALLAAAISDPSKSQNKLAMKLIKDLAEEQLFLKPHENIVILQGSKKIRAFALGPPRNADALKDLDPRGEEEFHLAAGARSPIGYFAAAAATPMGQSDSPFSNRFALNLANAHQDSIHGNFFSQHYGNEGDKDVYSCSIELMSSADDLVPDNAEWRRINDEWLHTADQLALAMNSYTNNASLVLAFELGHGGKVLLFAADAQRGNWASWADKDFVNGNDTVTVKDLLRRTVLYKVGHHCSHNATLNGKPDSPIANLAWMAQGKYADEFTAMITAVRKWAETQKGWDHPRKEIKDALIKKASGRVLQTDTNLADIQKPSDITQSEWKKFITQTTENTLYFDVTIQMD